MFPIELLCESVNFLVKITYIVIFLSESHIFHYINHCTGGILGMKIKPRPAKIDFSPCNNEGVASAAISGP
jgi:hypothetical protein